MDFKDDSMGEYPTPLPLLSWNALQAYISPELFDEDTKQPNNPRSATQKPDTTKTSTTPDIDTTPLDTMMITPRNVTVQLVLSPLHVPLIGPELEPITQARNFDQRVCILNT